MLVGVVVVLTSVTTAAGAATSARPGPDRGVTTRDAVMARPASVASDAQRPTAPKTAAVLLDDDFEGAFPGPWELLSADDTAWGTVTNRSVSPTHSVYCAGGGDAAPVGGPYQNSLQTWMVYGPFSLADATAASLDFQLWMKTEPASGGNFYDYVFYGVSTNGTNFSGRQTAGNSNGWGAASLDFSEVAGTLGASEVWFAFVFVSDTSVTDEGVYIDDVELNVTTSSPCALTCSASAPATATAGASVAFNGSATATNCSQAPAFSWTFGDGASSAQEDPSHTYAAAGTYGWQMTATADSQSCARSGSITVNTGGGSVEYDHVRWVPAAAHAQGALGSQWRTDVGLLNTGTMAVRVRLRLHGSVSGTLDVTVPAGGQTVLADVVGQMGVTGSGSLEVLSDEEIYVSSRTYNQSGSGTFGQYLDGAAPTEALTSGQSAMLPHLAESSSFRTNIGLLNTSSSPATVRVELLGAGGAVLGSYDRTIPAGQLLQDNQPFRNLAGQTNLARGSARVRLLTGTGIIAYASVVDNLTQDPTTIPMKPATGQTATGWVAAAAHAQGALGSQWRTDLGLLNTGTGTAHVTVLFHQGTGTASMVRNLSPGEQAVLADVVGMMGASGSGSLEVQSDLALYITSRTYNQSGSGTFGQYLDGMAASAGLGTGQSAYLPQLAENAQYRTNIGFVNTGGTTATVQVELLDASGSVLATFSQDVAPGQSWQANRPFSTQAGRTNLSGGSARVTVTAGSGVIAYASVVDNGTQDPTTIPMKRGAAFGVVLGTVTTVDGVAIAGATVTAGATTTTSNEQGYYVLDAVPVGERVAVRFERDGHVPTTKILRVREEEPNGQDAILGVYEASGTISAGAGGTVTTSDGGRITIPGGVLVNETGGTFTGNATVTLTTFDPSNTRELDAFPGLFEGLGLDGLVVPINTYGFADVTVTSGTQTLQLTSGATATLEVPIPGSLLTEAPASMPSWWFDPATATWREVGTFVRDGGVYRTELPHFSVWNCDVAATRCFVTGRVVDGTGAPVSGARVTFRSYRSARGYVTSGETSTPEDGTFRVPVDANSDIEFWAEKGNLESVHRFAQSCANGDTMDVGAIVLDDGGGGTSTISITLTWGAEPRDLDSHLAIPLDAGGWAHVYYANRSAADAELDTDDTSGYGPEIITVSSVHDGTYRYSVHQYSGSGDFTTSNARVSVVGAGVSLRTFTPPQTGAGGDDDQWRVFDLQCNAGRCTLHPIEDYVHQVSPHDHPAFEP